MYYIYEISDFVQPDGSIGKIGLTKQEPALRVKQQGYSDHNVIEQHTCIYKASEREIELQKEYGYPVDNVPYWQTLSVITKEGRIKAGKITGKRNVESGHLARIGAKGGKHPNYGLRKLTYEKAEYIRAQYKRGKDVFGNRITQRRLANVFGVDQRVILEILKNRTYTTP